MEMAEIFYKTKSINAFGKKFTLNFDYIKLINLHVNQELSEKKHGGHNKQNFMLNIKTLFCLLADINVKIKKI